MSSEYVQNHLKASLSKEIVEGITSAKISDRRLVVVFDATGKSAESRAKIEVEIERVAYTMEGVSTVNVAMVAEKASRRIIAIGSGKGGVGKSTLTTNLAVALRKLGTNVGVVDADIYGPSQPKLLKTEGMKPTAAGERLIPVMSNYGVPVLSMGFLVKPSQALAWRGPMAGNALSQLIDAEWGETDVLLIDLPPGTGDVQLSMLQKHKPEGAILVSTPQDLALIDAARAGQLFEQSEVPIIGLVENMAGYACPHCGEISDPFGSGGFEAMAKRIEIPFLGRISLSPAIRTAGDVGVPPAAGNNSDGEAFVRIAHELKKWLEY